MKSILGEQDSCYICGRTGHLTEHHIYYGSSNRKNSTKYGMTAQLCYECHEKVHRGKGGPALSLKLKQEFQMLFEKRYSREKFMQVIGKNYL